MNHWLTTTPEENSLAQVLKYLLFAVVSDCSTSFLVNTHISRDHLPNHVATEGVEEGVDHLYQHRILYDNIASCRVLKNVANLVS